MVVLRHAHSVGVRKMGVAGVTVVGVWVGREAVVVRLREGDLVAARYGDVPAAAGGR